MANPSDFLGTMFYIQQRRDAQRQQQQAQADTAMQQLAAQRQGDQQQKEEAAQVAGQAATASGKPVPLFDDARLERFAQMGADKAISYLADQKNQAEIRQSEQQRQADQQKWQTQFNQGEEGNRFAAQLTQSADEAEKNRREQETLERMHLQGQREMLGFRRDPETVKYTVAELDKAIDDERKADAKDTADYIKSKGDLGRIGMKELTDPSTEIGQKGAAHKARIQQLTDAKLQLLQAHAPVLGGLVSTQAPQPPVAPQPPSGQPAQPANTPQPKPGINPDMANALRRGLPWPPPSVASPSQSAQVPPQNEAGSGVE